MSDSSRNTAGMITLATILILAGVYCISAHHTQLILEAIQTRNLTDPGMQLPASSDQCESQSVMPEEFRQQIGDEFRKMWMNDQPSSLTPVKNAAPRDLSRS